MRNVHITFLHQWIRIWIKKKNRTRLCTEQPDMDPKSLTNRHYLYIFFTISIYLSKNISNIWTFWTFLPINEIKVYILLGHSLILFILEVRVRIRSIWTRIPKLVCLFRMSICCVRTLSTWARWRSRRRTTPGPWNPSAISSRRHAMIISGVFRGRRRRFPQKNERKKGDNCHKSDPL